MAIGLAVLFGGPGLFGYYRHRGATQDVQHETLVNDPSTNATTEPEDAPEPCDFYQLQGAPPYPVGYIPYNQQTRVPPAYNPEFPNGCVAPPSAPPEGATGCPSELPV